MTEDVLIVFLKAPRPGAVKTRLLPALSEEEAALVYRALAEAAVRATAPAPGGYRRVFFFTPAEARAEMAAWLPGAALFAQEGGDLGARMLHALSAALAGGAARAAVIGSDVPWLTREAVEAAFAGLEGHDLVLGPSPDGGYYLIALRQAHPGLFADVPWSTPEVLRATRERAARLGLRVRLLPPLPDVDTVEDLRREWGRLRPLLADRPEAARRMEARLGLAAPGG